jgi:hypothetical protein
MSGRREERTELNAHDEYGKEKRRFFAVSQVPGDDRFGKTTIFVYYMGNTDNNDTRVRPSSITIIDYYIGIRSFFFYFFSPFKTTLQ